jgi:hypothetical protein
MEIHAKNNERSVVSFVELLQSEHFPSFAKNLGSRDFRAATQHFVERTDRSQRPMPVFPDAGANTDIAEMRSPFMDTHVPATLCERCRRCKAGDTGASNLGVSAVGH